MSRNFRLLQLNLPRTWSRNSKKSNSPFTQSRRLASSNTIRSRFERFNARMPQFLQQYTRPLIHAPVTHISAFLILHELTAVIPLFGLAGLFHYTQWLPSFLQNSKSVAEGVEKLGRYARRKGWLKEEDQQEVAHAAQTGELGQVWHANGSQSGLLQSNGTRILLEFATAYALTKILLPARIALSVWATPWFASRVLHRLNRILPPRMRSGMAASAPGLSVRSSPAAGTNAIGGGVTSL